MCTNCSDTEPVPGSYRRARRSRNKASTTASQHTQSGIKSSCTTRSLQYTGIPLFATFRALEWSLNIGAGMELGFGKNSAVFVQPGFSWHIPDDSALESFYTEHPASFNLSFGYRLRLF